MAVKLSLFGEEAGKWNYSEYSSLLRGARSTEYYDADGVNLHCGDCSANNRVRREPIRRSQRGSDCLGLAPISSEINKEYPRTRREKEAVRERRQRARCRWLGSYMNELLWINTPRRWSTLPPMPRRYPIHPATPPFRPNITRPYLFLHWSVRVRAQGTVID